MMLRLWWNIGALDLVNFFLADVRGVFGPYLGVFLVTQQHWNQAAVGLIATIGGLIGQAEEAAVTVEIASMPSLEHLRPHTDLARVTLTAWLHGKPLSQGHMQVQLTAPPRTTGLATDFPGVAGTPLFAFDSELLDGSITLQYRFPIRGTYTFDLELTPVPGGSVFPPTRLRQTVRIADHPVMMRSTWLLVGLFVLGMVPGVLVARYAAARAKRRSRALMALLLVSCGALAPISTVAAHAGHPEHAAQGAPERQVIEGDDGWALEIYAIPLPVTVGHLLQLALWLRKDDAVFPGMTEVSIAAVNLEDARTVVEIHILARQGSISQSLQFYESVPHTIAVTVRPVAGETRGWALPTVGLSVDVMAVGMILVTLATEGQRNRVASCVETPASSSAKTLERIRHQWQC
jgi:hypothetical protein